ncbi:ImmA/IrrE family metallo-endopeptidase [Mariprofundus ferrooxydans]|nr:ImmA/IrrE family metallo-endopeptidase [Mariprofundus ferrooxydans]
MNLSRMELADFGNPTKIVEAIFQQFSKIRLPIPVEDIALSLDIKEIAKLSTQGYVGGLLIDKDLSSGIILVSDNLSEQRRRFTIGHELGHFLIPWHAMDANLTFSCSAEQMRIGDVASKDKYRRKEAEANKFSAELIMPSSLFRQEMRKKPEPCLGDIFSMADRFNVSKEACARRYVELHDEVCAIVISKDGFVCYFYRQDEFPYLNVQQEMPIPKGVLSADPKIMAGELTEAIEVESDTWLSESKEQLPPTLVEQTYKYPSGYQMTLLYLVGEEDQGDDLMDGVCF